MQNLKPLTLEQLSFLSKYEDNIKTAVEAGWARQRPDGADKKMVAILEYVTGKKYPFHSGCGQCEIQLLRDIAKVYFPAKEATHLEAPIPAKKDKAVAKLAEEGETIKDIAAGAIAIEEMEEKAPKKEKKSKTTKKSK